MKKNLDFFVVFGEFCQNIYHISIILNKHTHGFNENQPVSDHTTFHKIWTSQTPVVAMLKF